MKAYLIDPLESKTSEIVINAWEDISPAIGCQYFDVVGLNDYDDDTIYVDEEGLLNGAFRRIGGFAVDGAYNPNPLAGRGVVLGIDEETGESSDPKITLDELKNRVWWVL